MTASPSMGVPKLWSPVLIHADAVSVVVHRPVESVATIFPYAAAARNVWRLGPAVAAVLVHDRPSMEMRVPSGPTATADSPVHATPATLTCASVPRTTDHAVPSVERRITPPLPTATRLLPD